MYSIFNFNFYNLSFSIFLSYSPFLLYFIKISEILKLKHTPNNLSENICIFVCSFTLHFIHESVDLRLKYYHIFVFLLFFFFTITHSSIPASLFSYLLFLIYSLFSLAFIYINCLKYLTVSPIYFRLNSFFMSCYLIKLSIS